MRLGSMILFAIPLLALTGGCARDERARSAAAPIRLGADLRDIAGMVRGQATIIDGQMRVIASGLQPGLHGLHIHAVGRCDAPDYKSAGGHWNPAARQHGRDNPMGSHDGDLPNLNVGSDGTGTLTAALPANAPPLLDADGASIIIHAAPDDLKSDPSGNSGTRIACGIVRPLS
jgi:superoxide dismutase, Cu-Zn family